MTTRRLINHKKLMFPLLLIGFLPANSHALNSYCLKWTNPVVTVAHEVFWMGWEAVIYEWTVVESEAWGPGAPGGVDYINQYPSGTTTQPVQHVLVNWEPGIWNIIGQSTQYTYIDTDPVQVIFNPEPGTCGETYTLP